MKTNQKKAIIIAVALIIVIAVAVVVVMSLGSKEKYVRIEEDGTRVNISEKLAETKTYKGLEFTNIKFTNSSSVTNLNADVKNTTSEDMPAQSINIKVLDRDGNVITTFRGNIDPVRAGESTILSAAILANYTNAYDIEIAE